MTTNKTLITTKDVEHIGKLANLKLTDSFIKKTVGQLGSVLDLVSKIQSLDTTGVPETAQVTGQTNVLREDKVDKNRMLTQKEALANASETHDGYFVVPAVLKETD